MMRYQSHRGHGQITVVKVHKHHKAMITKAKKRNVETIYIATDPDREGEFIAWRLAEIFSNIKLRESHSMRSQKKPYSRLSRHLVKST